MVSRIGFQLLQVFGYLPLPLLRALGAGVGHVLYFSARWRRHVVLQNLQVCFPEMQEAPRHAMAKQAFVYFAQAWLDRSWLWHGSAACIEARVRFTGAVQELASDVPTIIFAPHFGNTAYAPG